MDTIADIAPRTGLTPFSLKDAPALIERVFPAQKVGIEAQKERKANVGQTLTALGSYWKGRKPLVLVRACLLASLLPATDDPAADLEIFEKLMRLDHDGMVRRSPTISAAHVWHSKAVSEGEKQAHLEQVRKKTGDQSPDSIESDCSSIKWKRIDFSGFSTRAERLIAQAELTAIRSSLKARAFANLSFAEQVSICERVEKVERLHEIGDFLYADIWKDVSVHLGTNSTSLIELVQELGIARFGHQPIVGDPFCGGGSIPFEAARVGFDVLASDLNPVAAMLTWASLNIIGANPKRRQEISREQDRVARAIRNHPVLQSSETRDNGDRAKSFLYCLETVDPQTGWRVPLSPTWIVSTDKKCVALLVPDPVHKRFSIEIKEGASAKEMSTAGLGTIRDGKVVYNTVSQISGETQEWRTTIARLRGDGEGPLLADGTPGSLLRRWGKHDFVPCEPIWDADHKPVLIGSSPGAWVGGDIWLERLYCIQWLDGADIRAGKSRPALRFAAPDEQDLEREDAVREFVSENIVEWQEAGQVADMPIEAGYNTTQPMRERGWTHWHHLFHPRSLIALSTAFAEANTPATRVSFARTLDFASRLSAWEGGAAKDLPGKVFSNQSLNTWFNYGLRASNFLARNFSDDADSFPLMSKGKVFSVTAENGTEFADLWLYDPPYADAVHYHEITEFFISWLRKSPPPPFDMWVWDSRRPHAIQGKGETFRSNMVTAFKSMADRMPSNGLQVCMFTHQDAGVWADMAGIVWGAGLRVTAAWYVSTETSSEMKKGGYVQGTVLLVLRKRKGEERAYRDELFLEVRGAVQRQVDLLTGLNQRAKAHQRDENSFSDADIQMAGYAAALEVLTGYTHIEGVDMTREALRPRVKGQIGIVEEMIALAVQTATELMRPDGIDESLWERLVPTERFWLKMTEAEANRPPGQPAGKLDDYQNFAKAYRADGWDDLMADSTPNKARLKGAAEFKRAMMTGHPFAGGLVRPVLYAVNELRMSAEKEEDHATASERAISGLRDNLKSWAQQRQQAMIIADWLGRTLNRHRPSEASAARTLAALIRTERLG
jgi:putative DNA methylase